MQKIWLWTELVCNSDVRASVRSSQKIKGVIVNSKGEGEESVSRVRYRFSVMCLIKCMGEIGLHLEFVSSSHVRVSASISLCFKVK